MSSVTSSIKAMPTIAVLAILLCGCGAHKPPKPEVTWDTNYSFTLKCPSGWHLVVNGNNVSGGTSTCERDKKQPIVAAPAVWVDAANESDQQLNAEFAAGHWSCPTGYQFEGQRWEMGQHTVKRKVANGQQVEVKPRCWRYRAGS